MSEGNYACLPITAATAIEQATIKKHVEDNWISIAAVAFNSHYVYGRGIVQLSDMWQTEDYISEDQIEDEQLKQALATYNPHTTVLAFFPGAGDSYVWGKFALRPAPNEAASIYHLTQRYEKNGAYRNAHASRLIRRTEVEDYQNFVQLALAIVESLHSTIITPYRQDVLRLAIRLIGHSQTIFGLSLQPELLVPRLGNRNAIVDVSSIASIFRIMVETYLTMHEVFFEPKTDNDFDFFHARWMLIGIHNVIKHTPADIYETFAPQEVEPLRIDAIERMKKTTQYRDELSQKKNDHEQTLKSLIQRNKDSDEWQRLAQSAHISIEDYQKIYSAFSGYVHSDGYTSFKLHHHDESEFDTLVDVLLYLVTGIVAKMVCDFAERYEDADYIARANTPIYEKIKKFDRSLSEK